MLVARRAETISRCARPDGRLGWGRWIQTVAPGEETMPSQASAPTSIAVEQAAHRAALFGLAGRARFTVGDLTRTGLPAAAADAVTSIDAFHFAADPAAAAAEARRILRPGRRLVLTNWQPKVPGDSRLPGRARIDWPPLLRGAGFTGVEME